MSYYVASEEELTSIASAIREKTGSAENLEFPDGFVSAISGIEIFEERENTRITPSQDKTIDPGETVVLGQLEVPSRTQAIKRVSPTSGYNPSNMQYYYNLSINNSTGVIAGVNFSIRNKTGSQITIEAGSMSVKLITYRPKVST